MAIRAVLLVENELDVIKVLESSLQEHGFSVTSFADSLHALDHFQSHKDDYYVIVSEAQMPVISGFELVKKTKQLNPQLKAVLLTPFEMQKQELAKLMPSCDVDSTLAKPVIGTQLVETINNLI